MTQRKPSEVRQKLPCLESEVVFPFHVIETNPRLENGSKDLYTLLSRKRNDDAPQTTSEGARTHENFNGAVTESTESASRRDPSASLQQESGDNGPDHGGDTFHEGHSAES